MKKNFRVGTEMSFKSRFNSNTQDKGVKSIRRRTPDGSEYYYTGVRLKPKAQAYVDSISSFEKEIF